MTIVHEGMDVKLAGKPKLAGEVVGYDGVDYVTSA